MSPTSSRPVGQPAAAGVPPVVGAGRGVNPGAAVDPGDGDEICVGSGDGAGGVEESGESPPQAANVSRAITPTAADAAKRLSRMVMPVYVGGDVLGILSLPAESRACATTRSPA